MDILSPIRMAFRKFRKHDKFHFINLFSLLIGLFMTLLLALYVQKELTYDRFHTKADRIVRLTSSQTIEGVKNQYATTPTPIANLVNNELPEVEAITRLQLPYETSVIQYGDKSFTEEGIFVSEPSFFQIFNIELIQGAGSGLQQPSTIILTDRLAEKLFGETNPLGETVKVATGWQLQVIGIMKQFPENSHFSPNAIISISTFSSFGIENDWFLNSYTYALLKQSTNSYGFLSRVNSLIDQHRPDELTDFRIEIQKLKDIHLHSNLLFEIANNGNVRSLYLLMTLGIFSLLISFTNYLNLSLSQAAKRQKEVGIKKVFGASNLNLKLQFVLEAMISVSIAYLISLTLVWLLLPSITRFLAVDLGRSALVSMEFIVGSFTCSLAIATIVGILIALKFSNLHLIPAFQSQMNFRKNKLTLRQTLLTFQFIISTITVTGLLIMTQQIDYMKSVETGFEIENIMVIKIPTTPNFNISNNHGLRQSLLKRSEVSEVASSTFLPGIENWRDYYSIETRNGLKEVLINEMFVDHQYLSLLEISIARGRGFDISRPADYDNFLINEAAARAFGWNKPLGKKIEYPGDGSEGSLVQGKVIGVIKDVHFSSLHHKIEPTILRLPWSKKESLDYMYLKFTTKDFREFERKAKRIFEMHYLDFPFEYELLTDRHNQLYASDEAFTNLVTVTSLFMTIMACLGVFSLSAYTLQQRAREVTIRKLLGATAKRLIVLLSKEFFVVVLVAILISIPISFHLMTQWLSGFSYRIEITSLVFFVAGIIMMLIALGISGWSTLKMTNSNPVDELRNE